MSDTILTPDWPAPARVRAASTTRRGGVSAPPYDTLILAAHVGDDTGCVAENRRRLRENVGLPSEPVWLTQVHGTQAVPAHAVSGAEADAAWTDRPGVVCAVMTADCLPVLLCDRRGGRVAAAHAGWRGLAAGVLESAVQAMGGEGEHLMAWLGPAIGPDAFEVGEEVREIFVQADARAVAAFRPSLSDDGGSRWLADIYTLARLRLETAGVGAVFGGGYCTYTKSDRFYSYRRDKETGRMASLIWLE